MHELVISGHFKNLAKIDQFIEQVGLQADFDDATIYNVRMAVDEACTNIIEHAYGGEGKGAIRLVCEPQTEGLLITIYDQGQRFDPTSIRNLDINAPLEARSNNGMGVYLMRQLIDTVTYRFDTPEGNQLILFKRRS